MFLAIQKLLLPVEYPAVTTYILNTFKHHILHSCSALYIQEWKHRTLETYMAEDEVYVYVCIHVCIHSFQRL